MQGEIHIVNEINPKIVSNQSLNILPQYNEYQTCLYKNGENMIQGGDDSCMSTTISFVTTLRLETK